MKEVEGRGALQRSPAVYFRNVGCKDLSKRQQAGVRTCRYYLWVRAPEVWYSLGVLGVLGLRHTV